MTGSSPLGVGIVGAGFMGRAHLAAYASARTDGIANRIVAVSGRGLDGAAGAARGNLTLEADPEVLGLNGALLTGDAGEVLEHPAVDAVSICTPTDTHVALASAALRAGKHVLLEKPVAVSSAAVEELFEVARTSDRLCMPAMCVRYWPGWDWLAQRIAAGDLGRVRTAVFRRLGSAPDWSRDFYGDATRTGGALFDLHVHDVDFVRHCFGTPSSVHARGTLDHVVATYSFDEAGPDVVVAEGGWDHAPGFPFRMEFTVVFENATAEFVLGREPALTLARGGELEPVALEDANGYDGEVRAFLAALANGDRTGLPTLEDALAVTRTLEEEARGLR